MATYRKVSRLVPSEQRQAAITDVEAGDQIDIALILGRPARRVKIVPDDTSDSIEIRLNNRMRMPTYYPKDELLGIRCEETPTPIYVVSAGEHFPTYTLTGSAQYYTEEGLQVSFVDINDITFGSGGTSITIYCW